MDLHTAKPRQNWQLVGLWGNVHTSGSPLFVHAHEDVIHIPAVSLTLCRWLTAGGGVKKSRISTTNAPCKMLRKISLATGGRKCITHNTHDVYLWQTVIPKEIQRTFNFDLLPRFYWVTHVHQVYNDSVFSLTYSVEVMCPDAVLVAVDGCLTFVPLHKSHPPPSLPCIYLHCVTMWLGVSDFIREVWTCTLKHGCLVQGQTLCPKTRAKCEWRKMDTRQAEGQSG